MRRLAQFGSGFESKVEQECVADAVSRNNPRPRGCRCMILANLAIFQAGFAYYAPYSRASSCDNISYASLIPHHFQTPEIASHL